MSTFATLFSGGELAGVGMIAAGLRPLWGIELEAEIAAIGNRNTGDHILTADVRSVDYSALETPCWLHLSPPCTRASQANVEAGEDALDLELAQACVRAIAQRPEWVSIENVWGYREFESFRIILRALVDHGYAFDYWHLNAASFGVPQTRKRLFLVASRTRRPRKPVATHAKRSESAQESLFETLPAWNGWYGAIADLVPSLPDSAFAPWQLERLPAHVAGSFYTIPQQSDDKKGVGVGYGCPRRSPNEPAFTVTAQSPGWYKAFLVSSNSVDGDGIATRESHEPSVTVTTGTGERVRAWLSAGRVVSLTPRALARFQSVPDWYVLPGKAALAGRIIGNGVACDLMAAVVRAQGAV